MAEVALEDASVEASEDAAFLEEVDFLGAAFFGGADSVETLGDSEEALVLGEILAIGVSILARESKRAVQKGSVKVNAKGHHKRSIHKGAMNGGCIAKTAKRQERCGGIPRHKPMRSQGAGP